MAFKIAIDAGHCLHTLGKRVDKALDPAQTREWTLNDRVARHLAEAAKQYENVETLRVDDPTGKKDVSLSARCKASNDWDADVYISCHHNAGIKLGSGGGIEAYSYKEGTKGAEYRDEIYAACIAAGGLKGNRSDPTKTANFYVLKNTKAPAVLMEYGFMDSRTDAPVILTDAYAKLVGYATMEGIAKAAGLKKRVEKKPSTEPKADKLAVTGVWDSTLTRRLQEIFNTTVDGIVSNQHACYKSDNPGLTTGWDWNAKPNGKGSQLIKAMQDWAGMPESEQNGHVGPKTFKAIQQMMGTTIDGYVSNPSQMVKALQRFANSQ